jgi:hypothetical protein
MRRSIFIALLLGLFVGVASLSAKDNQAKFKVAEVKHFTDANAVGMPAGIASQIDDRFRVRLVKDKVAAQVVEEGAAVPEAEAADSIVVEGKFTEFKEPGRSRWNAGKVGFEIHIYHRSDHSLITTVSHECSIAGKVAGRDLDVVYFSADDASNQIKLALK